MNNEQQQKKLDYINEMRMKKNCIKCKKNQWWMDPFNYWIHSFFYSQHSWYKTRIMMMMNIYFFFLIAILFFQFVQHPTGVCVGVCDKLFPIPFFFYYLFHLFNIIDWHNVCFVIIIIQRKKMLDKQQQQLQNRKSLWNFHFEQKINKQNNDWKKRCFHCHH